MGRVLDTSGFVAIERAVVATADSLGYGVRVGPQDEAHFRTVPDLRVKTLSTPAEPRS